AECRSGSVRSGNLGRWVAWTVTHERRNPPKEMLDPTTGFAAAWHRRLLERRKQKEKERALQKKRAREQAKPQRGSEIE
ncbi:hypothetical protein NRY67_01150, partial [Acidithiobacillus ferrooxidans]|nr:hypothetical protein [Acidithiobacillus ferrooxidans]